MPLLLTLALREVTERALQRGGPTERRGAGQSSIVCWYLAYSAIFALAAENVWTVPPRAQPCWGYAVLWSGVALRAVSLREIGAYYHPLVLIRDQHRLIASGPYRWLRHPLHLGLQLEMAGLALLAGGLLAWIAFFLSLCVLAWRNVREEEAMQRFFGPTYDRYRRQAWDVIDLVPGLRKP